MRAYLGAALVVLWAVAVAWAYLRRPRPPVEPSAESFWDLARPWPEPDWDTYQAAILR